MSRKIADTLKMSYNALSIVQDAIAMICLQWLAVQDPVLNSERKGREEDELEGEQRRKAEKWKVLSSGLS